MGRKLTRNVHVQGTAFNAGDELPDDLAKLVTNPKAFADPEASTADDGDTEGAKSTRPARKPAAESKE
jgi:hypothetical protein